MDPKFPEIYVPGMNATPPSSLQKRLRQRMDALEINALQAAKKAGLGGSFVRDILRGKTRSPSAENLAKLATALETTPDFLRGITETEANSTEIEVVGLPVVSSVRAGRWLEVTTLDDDFEQEIIPVARDMRFPAARQYALKIIGDSMDLEFPDGCYVTCIDYWQAGIPIRDGLRVHVERTKGGGQLVEITIKAIDTIDGVQMLVPRSSNPKWKPIPIEGDDETTVTVRGIVTGSWRPTLL